MRKLFIILSLFFLIPSACCFAQQYFVWAQVAVDSTLPSPYDPYAFFVKFTLSTNLENDTMYILRRDVNSFIIRDSTNINDTSVLIVKRKPRVTGLSKEPVPSPLRVQIYYNDFWMVNDSKPQVSDSFGKWYIVTKDKPISVYRRYDLVSTDAADLRGFFWDKKKLKIKEFKGVVKCHFIRKMRGDSYFSVPLTIPADKLVGLLR